MSINHAAVDRLIDSMSFTQKVGQLNQRLFGWKSVERNAAGRLVPQTSSSKRSTGGAGLALCTACCELTRGRASIGAMAYA